MAPLGAGALPDLRNFKGTLGIPVAGRRTHWSALEVSLAFDQAGVRGSLQPVVGYTDSGDGEQLSRLGAAYFSEDENDSASSSPADAPGELVTLNDYRGSPKPATFNITVRADAAAPATKVALTISIDGVAQAETEVEAGEELELGSFTAGTEISVRVRNQSGPGSVRANILQDDCTLASTHCAGESCSATTTYSVWPSHCPN